ncbi:MAG: DUF3047 domain-containing protein [Rhodothermales bacterium]|nr:DUF3047 domain-containing protein [Rhodothermales bacterium]
MLLFAPLASNMVSYGQTSTDAATIIIDDFERYRAGDAPYNWKKVSGNKLIDSEKELIVDDDYFVIMDESNNKFIRAYVDNESTQVVRPRDDGYKWNLKTHRILQWDWRAVALPDGANERNSSTNDTGGALYVTFSKDFIGRPRIIKYSYSSTLPVDSVVRFGRLVVIVASSASEAMGSWVHVERDVVEDYIRVFGKRPPDEPLAIALWSDSDNTEDVAMVDFDNIELLSTIDERN